MSVAVNLAAYLSSECIKYNMVTKIDLRKFSKNERSSLKKVARFAKEHRDDTIPARDIAEEIHRYDDPNEGGDRYLEISPRHLNSMYIVLQDVKADTEEHYQDQEVKSSHGDTVVNDPGGMKDRSLKGINGLIENGLKRT